jgi:hypothetical protein
MDETEPKCEHGTALDVHCCNCHSGFIFDRHHECPPIERKHKWIFYMNGSFCEICGASIGSGQPCK